MAKTKTKASTKRGKYKLQMQFNDEVISCRTDDLRKSILDMSPAVLKTRIKIRVEKDGKVCDRIYTRPKGRMLFSKKLMLDIFINKLILK